MLFTGHLTIFAINVFNRIINPRNWEEIGETYPSSCDKNFTLWVVVFLELHYMENRVCGWS
jgi:hypothetical protein